MSENKITYIERKYMAFIDKHGYIPKVFDAYNERDCGGGVSNVDYKQHPGKRRCMFNNCL